MTRSGLTIIEVLISLAILGVLFAVLAVTQVSTFHITRNSQQASSAMQVAGKQLDDLSRKVLHDYADYSTCPGATSVSCSGTISTGGATGNFSITPSPTSFSGGAGGTDVLVIDVSLSKPASVSLSTQVSCIDESKPTSSSLSMPTVADPAACNPN